MIGIDVRVKALILRADSQITICSTLRISFLGNILTLPAHPQQSRSTNGIFMVFANDKISHQITSLEGQLVELQGYDSSNSLIFEGCSTIELPSQDDTTSVEDLKHYPTVSPYLQYLENAAIHIVVKSASEEIGTACVCFTLYSIQPPLENMYVTCTGRRKFSPRTAIQIPPSSPVPVNSTDSNINNDIIHDRELPVGNDPLLMQLLKMQCEKAIEVDTDATQTADTSLAHSEDTDTLSTISLPFLPELVSDADDLPSEAPVAIVSKHRDVSFTERAQSRNADNKARAIPTSASFKSTSKSKASDDKEQMSVPVAKSTRTPVANRYRAKVQLVLRSEGNGQESVTPSHGLGRPAGRRTKVIEPRQPRDDCDDSRALPYKTLRIQEPPVLCYTKPA
jgi:hypothetical protein